MIALLTKYLKPQQPEINQGPQKRRKVSVQQAARDAAEWCDLLDTSERGRALIKNAFEENFIITIGDVAALSGEDLRKIIPPVGLFNIVMNMKDNLINYDD